MLGLYAGAIIMQRGGGVFPMLFGPSDPGGGGQGISPDYYYYYSYQRSPYSIYAYTVALFSRPYGHYIRSRHSYRVTLCGHQEPPCP